MDKTINNMKLSKKEYKLNNDFTIVCVTKENKKGEKLYGIFVEQTSLPFLQTLESYNGLSNPDEANNLFKELKNKYKKGL